MGSDYHEKDFEDEVYEDDYYEEHYEEEELTEDSERLEEEELTEDEEAEESIEEEAAPGEGWDDDEKKVTVSYACEECDYRWDDVIIKKKGAIEEEEIDIICPMCGSMNVTLI